MRPILKSLKSIMVKYWFTGFGVNGDNLIKIMGFLGEGEGVGGGWGCVPLLYKLTNKT